MAAIILSPLQNMRWMEIRYKFINRHPEVVFGCFCMGTRFKCICLNL